MAGLGLPVSKSFDLVGATKAVVALEADHSGSRLAAGGNDYQVHLYDFGGLKSDGKSFRSFEVTEGHPVVAVSFLWGNAHPPICSLLFAFVPLMCICKQYLIAQVPLCCILDA